MMRRVLLAVIFSVLIGGGLFFSLNGQKISHESKQDGTVVTVCSYNVENAFDMVSNGSEYAEYIPN